jgi:hypothetical protein
MKYDENWPNPSQSVSKIVCVGPVAMESFGLFTQYERAPLLTHSAVYKVYEVLLLLAAELLSKKAIKSSRVLWPIIVFTMFTEHYYYYSTLS